MAIKKSLPHKEAGFISVMPGYYDLVVFGLAVVVLARSAAFSFLLLPKLINIGAATNIEEYTPVITPISIAKAKPLVTSPLPGR